MISLEQQHTRISIFILNFLFRNFPIKLNQYLFYFVFLLWFLNFLKKKIQISLGNVLNYFFFCLTSWVKFYRKETIKNSHYSKIYHIDFIIKKKNFRIYNNKHKIMKLHMWIAVWFDEMVAIVLRVKINIFTFIWKQKQFK